MDVELHDKLACVHVRVLVYLGIVGLSGRPNKQT
jgi:hypothetical protein